MTDQNTDLDISGDRRASSPITRRTLDWSDRRHWNGGRSAPCIHCGKRTPLLDDAGLPAHKVCAEQTTPQPTNRRP